MRRKMESVLVMERRSKFTLAVLKDAPSMLELMEEFASGMEQNSNPAVLADVTTTLSKEESVLVMERRPMFTLAVLKDAPTFMSEEGSVLGMERSAKHAVIKDAQTNLSKEEFA